MILTQIAQDDASILKSHDLELGTSISRSGSWQCSLLFAKLQAYLWFRVDVVAGDCIFNLQVQDQKLRNYNILASTNNKRIIKGSSGGSVGQ